MNPPWTEELQLASAAARAAGEVTLRHFQARARVELKADGSPVTIADREAERLLRDRIAAAFPEDGILGEELGERPGRSGRRWILDPIDGTVSFIHGVPLYGVMVALEAHGDPVVGVLHFPALDETVEAARGLGCRWNGDPARVSETARLQAALVLTSGDAGRERDAAIAARVAGLDRLRRRAGHGRTWGDCYGYALVATGRAEAMLDPVLHAWDAAAVRPVIEEAGGVFTDWTGQVDHLSGHAVATNAVLAGEVRRAIAATDQPSTGTRP